MKCIICKNYSFSTICDKCQDIYLKPDFLTRTLPDGFKIYSFYRYKDVHELIKTKHTYIGSNIYKIMAKNSFKRFADEFSFVNSVFALPIDDKVDHGYSHTAILAKELRSIYIRPLFSVLRARNSVTYSGKSLDYRLANPREFEYKFKRGIDAIIVDDIVTTTTTLNEAKNRLLKYDVNPLFALTLADAKEA